MFRAISHLRYTETIMTKKKDKKVPMGKFGKK